MSYQKIKFEVESGELLIDGRKVSFDYAVRRDARAIVQVKDKLLVVLDTTRIICTERKLELNESPENLARNAYAVDKDRNILWRAELLTIEHPYVAFNFKSTGEVNALFDWGVVKKIDIDTGKLIRSKR